MKHTLIFLLALAVGACSMWPRQGDSLPMNTVGTALLARLPGVYDNHEQVWQARQAGKTLMPVRTRHRLQSLDGATGPWLWTVTMVRANEQNLEARWRYQSRRLDDGRVMLTPQRRLPGAGENEPGWASLAPCAMTGSVHDGALQVTANVAACSAILPGLGGSGALLPVRMNFDGDTLAVATFADLARGENAIERAVRVRWFDAWVAINGGGPDAEAGNNDWHTQRDLRLHDQGGRIPILWRDGQASGYSLQLERLTYAERGIRVLKLSLIRDADDGTVAYAWANPQATRIGLNLGWIQTGLSLETQRPQP